MPNVFTLGPSFDKHFEPLPVVTVPSATPGHRQIEFDHPPTSPGGNVHVHFLPATNPGDTLRSTSTPSSATTFKASPPATSARPTGSSRTPTPTVSRRSSTSRRSPSRHRACGPACNPTSSRRCLSSRRDGVSLDALPHRKKLLKRLSQNSYAHDART